MQLSLAGERVELLPEGAFWWPAERLLAVADLHWGKAAFLRWMGMAAPIGSEATDAERLNGLVKRLGALRLVVIGDWIHEGCFGPVELARWVERRDATEAGMRVDWALGNHDRGDLGGLQRDWLRVTRGGVNVGPFRFVHDASGSEEGFAVCGHLHPAVRLWLGGRERVRRPCFAREASRLILPAFGAFTGGHAIEPGCGELGLYALCGDEVVEVTRLAQRSRRRGSGR